MSRMLFDSVTVPLLMTVDVKGSRSGAQTIAPPTTGRTGTEHTLTFMLVLT